MVSGGKVGIVRHIADPLPEIFPDIYPQDKKKKKNRGIFCQECVCVFLKTNNDLSCEFFISTRLLIVQKFIS